MSPLGKECIYLEHMSAIFFISKLLWSPKIKYQMHWWEGCRPRLIDGLYICTCFQKRGQVPHVSHFCCHSQSFWTCGAAQAQFIPSHLVKSVKRQFRSSMLQYVLISLICFNLSTFIKIATCNFHWYSQSSCFCILIHLHFPMSPSWDPAGFVLRITVVQWWHSNKATRVSNVSTFYEA